ARAGQVLAARGALETGSRLRVDANGSWTIDEARLRLDAMGPLELAEEPVGGLEALAPLRKGGDPPAADGRGGLEALALVRNGGALPAADGGGGPLPLVADESVTSIEDAERADDLGAC